jgi:hypothetical protein
MKNGFDLKSALFCIAFTLCACFSFSQTIDTSRIDSKTIRDATMKSGISFSISPYIVNKAKTQPLTGNYHLTTSYKHGFEAGPDLYIHIKNSYSLMIGLHGGAAATNYKLFIRGSDFNPSLGADVDDRGKGPTTGLWSFYMSAPIWIQKRWYKGSNGCWNIVAGVNVRYYPRRYYPYGIGEIYTDGNGNQITVLEIDASIGNNLRPWLNYNIGGGYSLLLGNNNYLQCNLVANFSDKKIIDGTYQINVTGKPQSTGEYSANWSYVGLSFSYIFSGANKRMRKLFVTNNATRLNVQHNDTAKKALSKALFKRSWFGFYLSKYNAEKGKPVRQTGAYSMSASSVAGIEAGGNYYINFNKDYSLIVGAHVGFSGRNFKLFIPKSDFTPNLENDINFRGRLTKDYDIYLSAPIWAERRWTGKNNSTWNLDAGINLRFDPNEEGYGYDYGGIDVNGQGVLVLDMNGDIGNNLKPWLNYNVGGGYSFFLSNYNFLRINLLANFSATKIANFNYTIDVTGKPQSTGIYSANLSYVGLSFSYIFTGANKRLLKLYERNMN